MAQRQVISMTQLCGRMLPAARPRVPPTALITVRRVEFPPAFDGVSYFRQTEETTATLIPPRNRWR